MPHVAEVFVEGRLATAYLSCFLFQGDSVAMSYAARDTVPLKVCVNAQILWPGLLSAVCCAELHSHNQPTVVLKCQAKKPRCCANRSSEDE